jgi:Putative transposase DNA-binding domain
MAMSVLAASRVGEQSSAYRDAVWVSAPGGRIRTDAATAATSSAQDGRSLVAVVTATATCTAFRAVEERTGEVVTSRVLVERVGFLAALARAMSAVVVTARWNDGDLGGMESRIGLDGRSLPTKGWMALRRLGWGASMPEGVYVSDRVRRVADEAAARALRLAVHRHQILRAILAAWPADPRRRTDADWVAVRQHLPQGSSSAEVRNRTRQVRAWQADHAGRLPACLTQLEAAPRIRGVVLLAAADRQLVTIERVGSDGAVLHLQLPLTEQPASRSHWAWHAIQFRLPGYLPADADPCVPSLRVTGGRVRLDLPWRRAVPDAPGAGHAVALGLDWGVNTLLTGTIGKLASTPTGTRVVTDGRRLRFDATGISGKLHRLRGNREAVAARRDHYARLFDGLPATAPDRARLTTKQAVLEREHERICARIRGLNHALAWAAARWAVDQAWALGATVIYLEDLAMLEARGRRTGNARLSGQIRGSLVAAIRHLASKQGIATVTVPARGTSKLCPRCGEALHHAPAPDRPRERGWKWASCPSCGLAGDRDHAAAERIVARGLLAQAQVRTEPKTGQHTITTTVEGNVARARRPKRRTRAARQAGSAQATGPVASVTPGIHRPARSRPSAKPASRSSRREPDRRAVPAPATQVAGKRPAGQVPQTHPRRQAEVGSGPAHDCPRRRCRARRPGAGWGFHRNVTATAVLPLGDYGPATARPRLPERLNHSGKPQQSETLSEGLS